METLVKNATTVAAIYEAFGKGDVPFIISQLDKNVLWEVMGAKPNPIAGIYKGSANVPSFFLALATNYELENFQVQYIVDVDENTVIAKGHHGGKGPGGSLRHTQSGQCHRRRHGHRTEYAAVSDQRGGKGQCTTC